MSNAVQITKHLREVKALFFPRWDRQNLWRVNTRSRRTGHGYCDQERRVVEIMDPAPDEPDERDMLLIHEVCHAVTRGSHGNEWQSRMKRAAERAEELGRDRLAKLLCTEVMNSQEAPKGVKQMYSTIEDWLTEKPDLTLAQMKSAVAKHYGLRVSEVYKRMPRFKKVFQQAKKWKFNAHPNR